MSEGMKEENDPKNGPPGPFLRLEGKTMHTREKTLYRYNFFKNILLYVCSG